MTGAAGQTGAAATWLARYELVWLAVAAPLLLFPGWWTWVGLLLIAATWLARWWAFGRLTRRTLMDAPIALLMLMVLVGAATSLRPEWSWPRAAGVALGVATYYALVNSVKMEQHLRWLAAALILAGLGYAVVGLLGTDWSRVRFVNLPQVYGLIPTVIRGVAPAPVANGDLLNPRQAAEGVIVLLPIPITLLCFGRERRLRLLSALAVLVMLGALLLSQSLPGLVALAAALMLVAVWRSRTLLVLLPLGLVALAAICLAYGPRQAAVALLSLDSPAGIAVALRLDMWSRALAMIRDMPLTGIGLNTFPLIQFQFYPGFLLGPEPRAHNLYLQTALDLGLPGLLAFFWLLAASVRTMIKAYGASAEGDVRTLVVGLAASMLAQVTYGLMDMPPWGSRTQLAFWGILGAAAAALLVVGASGHPAPAAPRTLAWRARYAILVVAAIAATALVAASGVARVNLATMQAQRALLQARSASMVDGEALRSAEGALTEAVAQQPGNNHLYALLADVHGWLGDDLQATEALGRAVALDSPDPIAQYLPSEGILRRIEGRTGTDRWDDAMRVYSNWMERFPDRAAPYVQIAMIWHRYKQDPARAAAVIRSGLDHGALPQGLLSHYLSLIERGQ